MMKEYSNFLKTLRVTSTSNYNFWKVLGVQFLNYFISWKKHVSFRKYSTFNILNSIKLCRHDEYYHTKQNIFEIFWLVNHLGIKLCQLKAIIMGTIFRKCFHDLKDVILNLGHFLFTNLLQSKTSFDEFAVFYSWKVWKVSFLPSH